MNLHILWIILISLLFIGFLVLEGFDYGVGILLPFLGKNDTERRVILNSIGPFWDANEVWLITAGGAMFAAFPSWYATLFSSFYLEMLGILLALIIRGAAFEFRSQREDPRWRRCWDWLLCLGSALPGFFCGIIIANVLRGIPLDANMNYVGNFWLLFNPYALLCGLTFVLLFTLHGAIFLSLRLNDALMTRMLKAAQRLWLPTLLVVLLFVLASYFYSDAFRHLFLNPRLVPPGDLTLSALTAAGIFIVFKRSGWAFVMTTLTIVLAVTTLGLGLFPDVMLSSLNPAWNLTIDNTASSPYTLTVMSWLALSFLPFVLLYQAWNFWVFRKRVQPHAISHY